MRLYFVNKVRQTEFKVSSCLCFLLQVWLVEDDRHILAVLSCQDRARRGGGGFRCAPGAQAKVSGAHVKLSGVHQKVSGAHVKVSGAHAKVSGAHQKLSGEQVCLSYDFVDADPNAATDLGREFI